jgi:peptidoglycan/LPS O-acetylase OafA/YrhL
MLVLWPPGQQPWRTALRLLTLTQNLFAPMPPDDYFAVSWSLTIEEWFYLLFGASLLLAARAFGARRALALCLAAVILGPLALRLGEWDWSARGLALTKLVFFRLDEIGYGVLMAWLSGGRSRLFRAPWACLALGLPLIGLTWAGVLPVGRALAVNAVVIGCALCLPAALRLRAAPGWCATPVRWLATRSYTLYLVHETILINVAQAQVLGPARLAPSLGIAAAILLPLLLAELSYRFVERPILRRRPPQQVAHRAPAALRAPA